MLRIAPVYLCMLLSTLGHGEDATGFIPAPGCYNPPNESAMQLLNWNRKTLGLGVVLNLPDAVFWGPLPSDWLDVYGKQCVSVAECKAVNHARVQVLRIYKHFSFRYRARIATALAGNVELELPGGKKLSGSFKVVVRYPAKKISCE